MKKFEFNFKIYEKENLKIGLSSRICDTVKFNNTINQPTTTHSIKRVL